MSKSQGNDSNPDDIFCLNTDDLDLILESSKIVELPDIKIDVDALLRSYESIELPEPEIDVEALLKAGQLIDEAELDNLKFNPDELKALLDSIGTNIAFPLEDFSFEHSETGLTSQIDPNATTNDVANWMLLKIQNRGELHQSEAARYIIRHFGHKFVYKNGNGNWAISPDILKEFLRLRDLQRNKIPTILGEKR